MTEEQIDMLMQGLMWMGLITVKSVLGDINMSSWERLKGLIKK